MNADTLKVGVVVIGRSEGERLVRCLASLSGRAERIVYVDSGSTDGSVAHARSVGVDVVELDMSTPFTMARGRNAGFERLRELDPAIRYVQFVDGDCEMDERWIARATEELTRDAEVGVVFGRRRERDTGASIYNRLADMEWRGRPGDVRYCGGDAMIRAEAFERVGGYDASMIAGEEPEMCIRLRAAGWRIRRIDAEMTRHDAAMTRFGQWWRRGVRGGHAYAERGAMHGGASGLGERRAIASAIFWGAAVPLLLIVCVTLACVLSPRWWVGAAVLAAGYAALLLRITRHRLRLGDAAGESLWYAVFCVLGKPATCLGAARYWLDRLRRRRATLIEYKDAAG